MGVAQQHRDDRRHRQGQENAEETEQVTTGQHGEHHCDRMQADAVADQRRRQEKIADELTDPEHDQDRNQAQKTVELQQGSDAGGENALLRGPQRRGQREGTKLTRPASIPISSENSSPMMASPTE